MANVPQNEYPVGTWLKRKQDNNPWRVTETWIEGSVKRGQWRMYRVNSYDWLEGMDITLEQLLHEFSDNPTARVLYGKSVQG